MYLPARRNMYINRPNERNILAGIPNAERRAAHAFAADVGGAINRKSVGCSS